MASLPWKELTYFKPLLGELLENALLVAKENRRISGLTLSYSLVYSYRQPSDSYGPDGGGFGDAFGEMMFAPADQVPEKKKRSSRKERAATTKEASSPKSLRVKSSSRHSSRSDSSPNRGDEQPSTPPPVPRSRRSTDTEDEDDEEVWYAKWWMCGFADSFRDLVPKR